jgi:hypothetical protein
MSNMSKCSAKFTTVELETRLMTYAARQYGSGGGYSRGRYGGSSIGSGGGYEGLGTAT